MNPTDSRQRFSSLSIALHWVTVLLISAVYATILLRENYPKGTDIREGLKTWPFMLGLAVLALIVIRLMTRLGSRKPPITQIGRASCGGKGGQNVKHPVVA